MNLKQTHIAPAYPVQARNGATLTEVLISLLIFSVGIVSVFTLFPVSLLSSIQATKLTNSKILSDNVVELVRTNPGILRPPGADSDDPWKGEWKPNYAYSANDLVWPRIQPGQLFPRPNLAYRCTAGGTSGGEEPNWPTTGTVMDNGATWQALSLSNYVVDPLGRFIDGAGSERTTFGYNGVNTATSIARTPGGTLSDYTTAVPYFTQPDTWTIALEAVPTGVSSTSVTFDSKVDLSNVLSSDHRVVVISLDGTQSAVRNIQNVNVSGRTINLTGGNLPANLNSAGEVGSVRVETFTPRYSYLLTVRRTDVNLQPKVTAVILFNRSFSFSDEEVYDANFASSGSGFDGVSEVEGSPGANRVIVAWDQNPSTEPPPLLREGNYVFDARNVIWYQIVSVSDINTTTYSGKNRVVLTLDRPVEVRTPTTSDSNDVGRAIFMPGIVEIFEL